MVRTCDDTALAAAEAAEDAPVVANLRTAGAIIIGPIDPRG